MTRAKYGKNSDQESRTGFSSEEFKIIRACARKRFKEAQDEACNIFYSRMSMNLSRETAIPHLKTSGKGWCNDSKAWSRFSLMCMIDILAGTGMRPQTLADVERHHIALKDRNHLSVETQKTSRIMDALMSKESPKYLIKARTNKGGKLRQWNIVPKPRALPAIRMLLAHISTEPKTKLLGINHHSLASAFKKLLKECGLDVDHNGDNHSLYDLRHYYITESLIDGVSVALIAENTMTSMEMISKYYNHMRTELAYEELARERA